jgi:hypothetical protein
MKKLLLAVVLIVSLLGCASGFHKRLNQVKVTMNKAQVDQIMKTEGRIMGSEVQQDGSILELWDYAYENALSGEGETFRFYFVNDKLTQWGHGANQEATRKVWFKPSVSTSSSLSTNIQ